MNSEVIEKKILEDVELDRMLAYWKFRDRSVVALYGSFDVLHPGTFELITYAAEHGHELVVGIKPDGEMKKEKGAGKDPADAERRFYRHIPGNEGASGYHQAARSAAP